MLIQKNEATRLKELQSIMFNYKHDVPCNVLICFQTCYFENKKGTTLFNKILFKTNIHIFIFHVVFNKKYNKTKNID